MSGAILDDDDIKMLSEFVREAKSGEEGMARKALIAKICGGGDVERGAGMKKMAEGGCCCECHKSEAPEKDSTESWIAGMIKGKDLHSPPKEEEEEEPSK